MKRRTVLTGLGSAGLLLAGCVSVDSTPESTDDSTGSDQKTNTPAATDHNASSGSSPNGTETILAMMDGQNPHRPECEVEAEAIEIERGEETQTVETVGTIPYPDEPAAFTTDALIEFLEDFEEAYVHHNALCSGGDHILSVAYDVAETHTFEWYDEITTVLLIRIGGATHGVNEEGVEWQADMDFAGIVYAIDTTGIARATAPDVVRGITTENELVAESPDPLEDGELVHRFD